MFPQPIIWHQIEKINAWLHRTLCSIANPILMREGFNADNDEDEGKELPVILGPLLCSEK